MFPHVYDYTLHSQQIYQFTGYTWLNVQEEKCLSIPYYICFRMIISIYTYTIRLVIFVAVDTENIHWQCVFMEYIHIYTQ